MIKKKTIGAGSWLRSALLIVLGCVSAQAQVLINKQITIQPIFLSNGSVTANSGQILYEAESDKIWSQAGIDIKFLPGVTYVNGSYLNTSSNAPDSNSLLSLSQISGQSWSAGGVLANTVIRLFFVQLIDSVTSNLGYTLESGLRSGIGGSVVINQQNAIAIADNAFALNRVDVIAHEIGHALGLDHTTLGAGASTNLMSSPRPTPTFLNIYPDGAGYDQLTGTIGGTNWGDDINPGTIGYQIDRARKMTAAVDLPLGQQFIYNNAIPEPATTTAIAGSIMLALAGIWRRKRAD
ncbi:MAG: Peptidase s8 and s53 in kexin sedolisin [Lacunisphaera sp.]|nr:Peptidase s8 and s53 in kexin sedolisin [Lacunisphaera sp.]